MTLPQFGYCLPIFANPSAGLFRTPSLDRVDGPGTLALGVHAEALGYDSLWVADHLMLGKDEAILEGWTMLSALGGATTRARIGMIHQAHYFRHPAIAAKMSSTLDHLTGGRFIMFYDYGQQLRENRAYQETVDGIRLIRDLWSASSPLTSSHGAFGVAEATCTPLPVQQPHPPIWFGEVQPGLLAACAEFGQGWNTTPCSVPELRRRIGLLDAACAGAGRDGVEIEKSVEMQVLVAPEDEVRPLLGALLDKVPAGETVDPALRAFADGKGDALPAWFTDITLVGTPEQVRSQVQAYIEAGADHFLLWFLDAPDRSGMELFASEVMPAFR
jgi:alkanesulfonate monooxygenase SsuD/methylene tetrahydromethanopterin reductase-like flavin-dependent oxidoreductase (luciferase family)